MQVNRAVTLPGRRHTRDYLRLIGVPELPPLTSPFDPGYDPVTVEGHLDQSAHLMSLLKISMACWLIASESAARRKISASRMYGVPTVTGGGPFKIAAMQGHLEAYLDLCADMGVARVECGERFGDLPLKPVEVVRMAFERGLEVQFELGKKRGGVFREQNVERLIEQGSRWLDAGAVQLVIEASESAASADRFASAFGLAVALFEAPDKLSQFALLDHFGREVHLCDVRLEELLPVEIHRRGLDADSFGKEKLGPRNPPETRAAGG